MNAGVFFIDKGSRHPLSYIILFFFVLFAANPCSPPPVIHNSEGSPNFNPLDLQTGTAYNVKCGPGTKVRYFSGKMICNDHGNWTNVPNCEGR